MLKARKLQGVNRRLVEKWHRLAYELENDARRCYPALASDIRAVSSTLGNIVRRVEIVERGK